VNILYFLHSRFLTTCACPENRVSPEIFHCIEYIFYYSGFLSNAACPEKQSFTKIFHCIEYTFHRSWFLSNLRLPWKTDLPWNFSLYWKCIFYHSGFLSNAACPEKQSFPEIFHYIENVFSIIKDFWATCVCPEKQSCPGVVDCIKNVFFIIQDFWATCACPVKQSCPDFTVLNILFTFRILHQLALALKNRGCPENVHYIEYTFYLSGFLSNSRLPWKTELPWKSSLYWIYFLHSGFWATCACPEKQSCPGIFHCIENAFFIIQDFWATPLALKNRVSQKFFTVLRIIFIVQDFWANRACPEKQLPWIFSLYWNIFYHSVFLSNSRLSWKTEGALKIFTILNIYFIMQDFWATRACREKQSCPVNFHCSEYTVLFTFRIFNNLRLRWKQFPLKFFTVLNILFTIQDFMSNLRLP